MTKEKRNDPYFLSICSKHSTFACIDRKRGNIDISLDGFKTYYSPRTELTNGKLVKCTDGGIQNDSRLGFSTVSFLRRAISQRENFMKDSCCVRGRQGAIHSPGHWTRDLLRLPPIAAELPEEFEQSFLIGKPWFFGEHEFLTEQCILS